MNDTSQHLTLEQLTGDAALSPTAGAHLTECPRCEAELHDWAAVANATRLLTADGQPRPDLLDRILRDADRAVLAKRNRMNPYAAAAAAIVLFAGGYGLTSALSGAGHQSTPRHALTTGKLIPTGCGQIQLATGQLTAANGDDLTLRYGSGAVTVVASQDTTFTRLATGTVSDIADDDYAIVAGTPEGSPQAGGTFTATAVMATFPGPSVLSAPFPGPDVLFGKVTDVTSSGFTLHEGSGVQVDVVLSASMAVITEEHTTLSQLQLRKFTTAVGSAGPDGTLSAAAVSQQDVPQSVVSKLWPPEPTAPAGAPTLNTATPGAAGSDGRVARQPRSSQPQGSGAQPDSCEPGALTMAYLVRGTS
jgi:hypothetical protein